MISSLETNATQANGSIEQLQSGLDATNAEIAALQEDYDSTKARVAALERDLDFTNQTLTSTTNDVVVLKRTVAALESTTANNTTDIGVLKENVTDLSDTIDIISEQKADLATLRSLINGMIISLGAASTTEEADAIVFDTSVTVAKDTLKAPLLPSNHLTAHRYQWVLDTSLQRDITGWTTRLTTSGMRMRAHRETSV